MLQGKNIRKSHIQLLSPKAFELMTVMAGLLTYSMLRCLPGTFGGPVTFNFATLKELTAAGTVQDLHLFPS
jgi:hypothetical protein